MGADQIAQPHVVARAVSHRRYVLHGVLPRALARLGVAALLLSLGISDAARASRSVVASGEESCVGGRYDRCELWRSIDDGGGRAVAVSPDGALVYVTGTIHNEVDDEPRLSTIAYEARTGVPLWAATYGAMRGVGQHVAATAARVVSAGMVYPRNDDLTSHHMLTVVRDASTGAELWHRLHRSSGSVRPNEVIVTERAVYVVGSISEGCCDNEDFITIAYDLESGKRLWHKRYSPGRHAVDGALSQRSQTLLVVGYGKTGANIVAYDATDGGTLWNVQDAFSGGDATVVAGAESDHSGHSVYVAAARYRRTSNGIVFVDKNYVARYEARTGNVLWALDLPRSIGAAGDISVSDTGRSVAIGATKTISHDDKNRHLACVTSLDVSSTSRQWTSCTAAPKRLGNASVVDLEAAPDGKTVYMLAEAWRGDGLQLAEAEYLTVAFRATGRVLWRARYAGLPIDSGSYLATALATAPDGKRVYATGVSLKGSHKVATVAYDTGAP